MEMRIFLGKPSANIEQWIKDHRGGGGHADTWYKYADDTEWRTTSITGTISGSDIYSPTAQIPNVTDVVEVEIGTDVTSVGSYAFYSCRGLTSVTIGNSVTSIGEYAFSYCRSLMSITFPGKDKATVQGMDNYSWGLPTGYVIHCADGDIII